MTYLSFYRIEMTILKTFYSIDGLVSSYNGYNINRGGVHINSDYKESTIFYNVCCKGDCGS